ncbi:MAG: glutamine ABC transporter substrate-binding protein, partial [Lactobacillus crispatus]|nr:glutamine ABC transporter substrate-binding protein [Lactobacillus crispatus]
MKKLKRFFFFPLLLILALALTACGKHASNNVYQKVKESKTIVWGVRADTRLFG